MYFKQGSSQSRKIIQQVALLAITLTMSSCASTGQMSNNAVPVKATTAVLPDGWRQVKKNPPTYFPQGYPVDSPTTYKDGDWIYAGESGGQWFVPLKGVKGRSAAQLNSELHTLKHRTQVYDDYQNSSLRNRKNHHSVVGVIHKSAVTSILSPFILTWVVLQEGNNGAAQHLDDFDDFWDE